MIVTAIILILTAVAFSIGHIRSDLVALCALVLLILFGILTPQEALAGFSNPVVIMMIGLFVVGGGILQTGLAKIISGRIVRLAGKSELKLFFLVILVTTVIGAFISNTGTVALMMPIAVSMAASVGIKPSKLLMPLAFASSMGGMLTLIGSPPNLIIQESLTEAGYPPLSFFSFSPIGLVCIVVGIAVMLPLSRKFLSKTGENEGKKKRKTKTLKQLVSEYRLNDHLSVCTVRSESPAAGKTLAELDIQNRYGLTVLELRHEQNKSKTLIQGITQSPAQSNARIKVGDTIYLNGGKEQVKQMVEDLSLDWLEQTEEDSKEKGKETLDFYELGIAEVVLMPNSQFVNRTVKETGLRAKYGLNVVGIRRRGTTISEHISSTRLLSGDVLLVQGSWNRIAALSSDGDQWVVLGQPLQEAAKITLDYKAPIAAGIMILMIVMMVFDFIPIAPVTAVIIAALLMVVTGCLRNVEAAYKTINWESVVLIAAMMPMSVALEKTGISTLVSNTLVSSLGSLSPTILLAGIYFTTSLLTLFISNTATAVLMAPIALSSAAQLGVSPYAFLFAVAVAASMCFASPFSTPPNALVMQAGHYQFMDYIKVGLPLQIIMGIVMVFVLPLLFPM
ncbi:SLC13 family permease [Prevotella cerevisiae]|uniref:SLC13 family permease n=1 Tax=Segatella cerevisiae TaxID=2053716 RepID=A0ABT1BZ31_9BACT|nr:SLC13 family permease [Segatella cerevisiae]MCO6026080.1 SLC13 family permease [Segatella cerevisiae]